MIIEPAIDLKDQKVVRLHKGDFDTVHQVADDPVAVAKEFAAAGARVIHMVDLDGARSGKRINADIVRRVIAETGMKVEMGGGIRSMEDLKAVDEMGVWRFVIGSAAVSDPEFVAEAVKVYGERVAVGVDAKNGEVKTSGWEEGSGVHFLDFARKMQASDYEHYDLLIGMDYDNLRRMEMITGGDPKHKMHLLMEYAGEKMEEVSDPWYTRNFEKSYQDILRGCNGLMNQLKEKTYSAYDGGDD